jgi:UDP-2,3-diacylglucosamine pyrophosphatase LpxH
MKKIKLVISDFHLSRGKWLPDGRRNPLEDFHQDDRLSEFLEYYSTGDFQDADVEWVINGDFFDPLAVMPPDLSLNELRKLEFPIDVEEGAAVRQIETILKGHPVTVSAMRGFLARGKKIIFRWGNHDASILWPAVQRLIVEMLSPSSDRLIEFQDKPYVFDRICIDHGHQYEALNHFDENGIFIDQKTKQGNKRILSLPFGSFFVLGFLNRIKLERKYINQVQPFHLYLKYALIFEPVFFFLNGMRATWFFLKMRFITHPMRFARFGKTLRIVYEIFRRVDLENEAERILTGDGSDSLEFDTLILGHNHRATFRIFPNGKQYVNTGTWIPITSLDIATLGHRILRTYAYIEYVDGIPRTTLRIWNGSPKISDEFA